MNQALRDFLYIYKWKGAVNEISEYEVTRSFSPLKLNLFPISILLTTFRLLG